MAIETRPDTNQELPEESPYDALMAYGKERGYKLDWLQQQDSWGSRPDVGDTDSGGTNGYVPEATYAAGIHTLWIYQTSARTGISLFVFSRS